MTSKSKPELQAAIKKLIKKWTVKCMWNNMEWKPDNRGRHWVHEGGE